MTIFFPQYIHLINYISFSAGEHVSATTAKVMKEKTMSGDGHVKAMLYNKLTQDDENIMSFLKCSYHLQCLKWTVAQSPNILFGRPKAAPN